MQQHDFELEGPFLTLADFVRAQEIRERLRRRNKKPRSKTQAKSTQQTSTFELTATGHEETDHDLEERQSSYASDGRPGTSMSMATTAQAVQAPKKKMMHKMAQTVPQQGPQDPGMTIVSLGFRMNGGLTFAALFADMVLRRYLFNVDWSRKVPNIDAACRCTDVYQVSLANEQSAKLAHFSSYIPSYMNVFRNLGKASKMLSRKKGHAPNGAALSRQRW